MTGARTGWSAWMTTLIRPLLCWHGGFGLLLILDEYWPSSHPAALLGYVLSFTALATCVVVSAWVAANAPWPSRSLVISALVCFSAGVVLDTGLPSLTAFLRGALLLVVAAQIGAFFGRGVQDRSHIWPLVIVAVLVDTWSVFSHDGLSHALVVEGAAPAVHPLLLFSFPVPGVGVTPVLGVADLLFSGLLLAAFKALGFSLRLPLVGLAIGFCLCLFAVSLTGLPIPALVFIAPIPPLLFGRRLRPHWPEIILALVFVVVLLSAMEILR